MCRSVYMCTFLFFTPVTQSGSMLNVIKFDGTDALTYYKGDHHLIIFYI